MRIEIGDKYLVTADQYNYILQEKKLPKKARMLEVNTCKMSGISPESASL